MKEPRAEALRWLFQAENDLEYERHGFRGAYYAQICFQCQQTCEKGLKSIYYGRLGRRVVPGHSLVELSKSLDLDDALKQELAVLDQYYIPTRYPKGLPGGVPYEAYTRNQAERALATCETVIALARAQLPPEE
ncbi:MAG: HEPN domain-containing protein [Spirochaetia bacterium]